MIIRKSYALPEPDAREIYRYMGVHSEPDEAVKSLVKEAVEKLRGVVSCKVCYTKLPIERPDENTLIIGKIRTESVFLKKNLEDCSHAYLFFATVGNAPDRLIASMKHTPSKALALDAGASAVVEALCNTLNEEIRIKEASEGNFLRPRYSAGYGDFTLEYQKYFVEMLDAPKNVGVTLRNEAMLYPAKSVSALIGVSDKERTLK